MGRFIRHIGRRTWAPTVAFLIAFAAVPLVLVLAFPGVDDDEFVSKVQIRSQLAETLQGRLEYLLVDSLEGRSPAGRLVVAVDHGYTAGVPSDSGAGSDESLIPGASVWLQGSLMDRETYFGEQYLFFGYPQLYLTQVKSGLLWPSQVGRLGTLYWSPLATLTAVYWVWLYPFSEEYTLNSWLFLVARLLLFCVAVIIAATLRRRNGRWLPGLLWVLGLYALAAVALAVVDL